MELVFVWLFLLPFLSYIAVNILFHKPKTSKHTNANLPPGSTGWPVIGETMELGIMGGKGTPEIFYQNRMQKYSQQAFKTSLIGEKTVILCGVAGNKFIFSNENKLVTMFFPRNLGKILPHLGAVNDVAQVTYKARNILADFLKPDFLQGKAVKIIDELARKHLDSKWVSQKEVKVLSLAKEYAFSVGCKLFMSIEDPLIIQGIEKPFGVVTAGIYSIPVNLPGTAFNKGIKASKLIREKLLKIIRERKAHLMAGKSPWSQDMMWNMIMVPDDDGKFLSEVEIADDILAFLLASQDATSTAITFIVKYLAEFQQIYQEVLRGSSRMHFWAYCNFCSRRYQWTKGGDYGSMKRHIQNYHLEKFNQREEVIGCSGSRPGTSGENFIYDKNNCREQTVDFISAVGLHFSFSGREEFKHYIQNSFEPSFTRISRNTVVNDLKKKFKKRRLEIIKNLSSNQYKVCLCGDIWLDKVVGNNYLGITCHWIDSD